MLTVKLYAKGIIWRNLAITKKFKPSKLYQVKNHDFIYSKIDARNGAWGFIKEEFDGGLVSGDFPILELNFAKISKEYLEIVMSRDKMWLPIKNISSGTTGRRRVNPQEFLKVIMIALPSLNEQNQIVKTIESIGQKTESAQGKLSIYQNLFKTLLHELMNGERRIKF